MPSERSTIAKVIQDARDEQEIAKHDTYLLANLLSQDSPRMFLNKTLGVSGGGFNGSKVCHPQLYTTTLHIAADMPVCVIPKNHSNWLYIEILFAIKVFQRKLVLHSFEMLFAYHHHEAINKAHNKEFVTSGVFFKIKLLYFWILWYQK